MVYPMINPISDDICNRIRFTLALYALALPIRARTIETKLAQMTRKRSELNTNDPEHIHTRSSTRNGSGSKDQIMFVKVQENILSSDSSPYVFIHTLRIHRVSNTHTHAHAQTNAGTIAALLCCFFFCFCFCSCFCFCFLLTSTDFC